LFLFAGHSFLANSLRFLVKLIVKTIVINGKIHNNKRKRFYSSNKEGLICWYKSITASFCKFVLTKFQVNIKSQILKYTNRRFLYQIGHWIVLYSNYFHQTWVICSFLKANQSTCLSYKHGDHGDVGNRGTETNT
jgi:ascorbate-specific PTS system EIIC-type component UlaA